MPGLRVSPLRIFHRVVNGAPDVSASALSSEVVIRTNRERTSSALGIDVTMPHRTELDSSSLPDSVNNPGILEGVRTPVDLKPLLWNNLSALMKARWGKENMRRLGGITDNPASPLFSSSTGTRLKKQDTAVGIDVVAMCAHSLNVEPWQLLVPDLDPAAMPRLQQRVLSPQAASLAEQLDRIADPESRQRAYAVALAVIRLAEEGREPPPPFSPPP
jgi:hypothetical protein